MSDLNEDYRRRFGLEPGEDLKAAGPAPEGVIQRLRHSSIRKFTGAALPEPMVTALLAAAQSAPSKSNLQQYSILRLEDPAKRARLADMLGNSGWALEAPLFLVFLGDLRRNRREGELRGYPNRNDNADSFMNAAVDAALALQSFIAAAEAWGLGCCPISQVRGDLEGLGALLELPEGVFPIAGLAVGFADEEPATSQRLPPSLVQHLDRYDDSRLEEELAAYDDRVFAAAPIPPEKQRHVDLYGPAERGTWSEQTARQLSQPERQGFRAWLARQGISLG